VGVDVKVLGSVSFRMGWDGSGFGEIVWVAQPDQSATPKKVRSRPSSATNHLRWAELLPTYDGEVGFSDWALVVVNFPFWRCCPFPPHPGRISGAFPSIYREMLPSFFSPVPVPDSTDPPLVSQPPHHRTYRPHPP
jgi:hypothetical protein